MSLFVHKEANSNRTIEEACIIAAYNSKARDSAQVPVDYTLIKNVKKPERRKTGHGDFC